MKFLKSDELEVGKCYQLYNKDDKQQYKSIVKKLDEFYTLEVEWYRVAGEEIKRSQINEHYLYVEISIHSFNRLKRHVLAKLDC